eukprot:7305473-Pyramimonas_sp.AAC.1
MFAESVWHAGWRTSRRSRFGLDAATQQVVGQHRAARVAYCEGVKRKRQATLDRWAYVDGTTYYLDETA